MIAKKIGPAQYELRTDDGETFATLTRGHGGYLLAATDKALVVLFNRTKFTADVTLQGVLWAIRSMVDFLTQRRTAEAAEAASAAYLAELEAIRENARKDVDGGARLDRVGFRIAQTA